MKTTAYITLNDLVFENRNHDYGAYYLRKNYNRIASTALFSTLIIALLSISAHGLYKKYYSHQNVFNHRQVEVSGTFDISTIQPEEKIIIEEPKIIQQLERQLVFTVPVVTTNITTEVATLEELLHSQSGLINVTVGLDPGSIINTTIQNTVEITDESPRIAVDVPAEFPGGEKALLQSIYRNLIYPKVSRENDIQGKVFLQFVVGKDGRVSNVKILRSTVDDLCEQEAIKAVTLLPKWKPAEYNGHVCAMYFSLPIEFQIR